jgi:hypothetical protein
VSPSAFVVVGQTGVGRSRCDDQRHGPGVFLPYPVVHDLTPTPDATHGDERPVTDAGCYHRR